MEPEKDGKCRSLTPAECDNIFFPGSGGKPTRAKIICGSCPVQDICLRRAIESGLSGFWAGTTDKERSVMARLWHIKVVSVEALIPDEPKRMRVYRRISKPVQDTLDYLDSLREPPLEELVAVD